MQGSTTCCLSPIGRRLPSSPRPLTLIVPLLLDNISTNQLAEHILLSHLRLHPPQDFREFQVPGHKVVFVCIIKKSTLFWFWCRVGLGWVGFGPLLVVLLQRVLQLGGDLLEEDDLLAEVVLHLAAEVPYARPVEMLHLGQRGAGDDVAAVVEVPVRLLAVLHLGQGS